MHLKHCDVFHITPHGQLWWESNKIRREREIERETESDCLRVCVRGLKGTNRSGEGTEGFKKRLQENAGVVKSVYLE